ncbi:hypothetical protein Pint_14885 [Pistacia integerrima]|uniref:Uncharacterized protein n=1 Tax=Pistacia integerrima TaxID=434235 RepID=A0ACC0Z954_9ROSI|nr:hypothetical protein Pint_14885 [Pistacia integerrima]
MSGWDGGMFCKCPYVEMVNSRLILPATVDDKYLHLQPFRFCPFSKNQRLQEALMLGRLPVPHHESYGNMDKSRSVEDMNLENCPDLMSSKATSTSTSSGNQISKDTEIGNINQAHLDVETCVSHGPGDGKRNRSEEPKSENEIKEFPSFDLGF